MRAVPTRCFKTEGEDIINPDRGSRILEIGIHRKNWYPYHPLAGESPQIWPPGTDPMLQGCQILILFPQSCNKLFILFFFTQLNFFFSNMCKTHKFLLPCTFFAFIFWVHKSSSFMGDLLATLRLCLDRLRLARPVSNLTMRFGNSIL